MKCPEESRSCTCSGIHMSRLSHLAHPAATSPFVRKVLILRRFHNVSVSTVSRRLTRLQPVRMARSMPILRRNSDSTQRFTTWRSAMRVPLPSSAGLTIDPAHAPRKRGIGIPGLLSVALSPSGPSMPEGPPGFRTNAVRALVCGPVGNPSFERVAVCEARTAVPPSRFGEISTPTEFEACTPSSLPVRSCRT
jgi:hypothetical protein